MAKSESSATNNEVKTVAKTYGFEIIIKDYIATYYYKMNPIYKRTVKMGPLLPSYSYWKKYFEQEEENAKEKVVVLAEIGSMKLEMMLLPKFFLGGKEITAEEAISFFIDSQIKLRNIETQEQFHESILKYNSEVKR